MTSNITCADCLKYATGVCPYHRHTKEHKDDASILTVALYDDLSEETISETINLIRNLIPVFSVSRSTIKIDDFCRCRAPLSRGGYCVHCFKKIERP